MSENSTNEGPQVNVDMSKAEAQQRRREAHGKAFIERRVATQLAEPAVLAAQYEVSEQEFVNLATIAWHHEREELAATRALAESEGCSDFKVVE